MSIQRQNTGTERRQPDATPGEMGRSSNASDFKDQSDRGNPIRQPNRPDEPVVENGVRNNADKDQQKTIKKPQPSMADGDDQEGNDRERQDPDINTPIYHPASTEQKIPKM